MEPLAIVIPCLIAALTWTCVDLVLLRARRMAAEVSGGESRLRYPAVTRAVASVLAIVPPPALAWLMWSGGASREVSLALAAAAALAGYVLVVETFGVRIGVSAAGIVRESPWSGIGAIDWDDLASVRWAPPLRCFIACSAEGERVRVSLYLAGIGTFARYVIDEAPDAVTDERTTAHLKECADALEAETRPARG